jgi:hypothetical protein
LTDLPDLSAVQAPTNVVVVATTGPDSTIADGIRRTCLIATWTAPADQFVTSGGRVVFEFKKSADSTWLPAGSVNGTATQYRIQDISENVSYDVHCWAENAAGSKSSIVTVSSIAVLGPNGACWLDDDMVFAETASASLGSSSVRFQTSDSAYLGAGGPTNPGTVSDANVSDGAINITTSSTTDDMVGFMSPSPFWDSNNPSGIPAFFATINPISATNKRMRFGISLTGLTDNVLSYGCLFECYPGVANWRCLTTGGGGVTTTTTSSLAVAAGIRDFLIVRDSEGVKFYSRQNSSSEWTLLATHTTDIPTVVLRVWFQVKTTVASAASLRVHKLKTVMGV